MTRIVNSQQSSPNKRLKMALIFTFFSLIFQTILSPREDGWPTISGSMITSNTCVHAVTSCSIITSKYMCACCNFLLYNNIKYMCACCNFLHVLFLVCTSLISIARLTSRLYLFKIYVCMFIYFFIFNLFDIYIIYYLDLTKYIYFLISN